METCHFCKQHGENYDYLTQLSFCKLCFWDLNQTARHLYYDHFRLRLKQRYAVDLDVCVYNEILNQIKDSSKNTFIYESSKKRSIHKVLVSGIKAFVVYKKGGEGALVTALPKATFVCGIKLK